MADAPNQYNTNLQDPNAILSSLQTLINSTSAQPVQTVSVPSLNFTAPSGSDITSKYQEFLTDAANDPNLVNYYNQLLSYAQGDTNVAIQQLQTDYNTGVRQTTDTLKNSLAQLGQTFTTESNNLLDTLNKRGIALTQTGANGSSSPLAYGGGGESQTEYNQLNQSQQLRQEAEQRSAQQGIENAGLTRNKGITSANEALQNQAISLQQQKQQDITNRANMGYQNYQNQQFQNAQLALYKQQGLGGSTGSSGGFSGNYTQQQLPSQLFNATGNVSYNGQNYNVSNPGNGTRNVSLA